jgi:uncharacterized protein (DUF1778 family)
MAGAMTRLDFRLQPALKRRIERAAAVSGQTLSSFAVSALLREADQLLARDVAVTLDAKASRALVARLDRDLRPNRQLRRAARRHQELLG